MPWMEDAAAAHLMMQQLARSEGLGLADQVVYNQIHLVDSLRLHRLSRQSCQWVGSRWIGARPGYLTPMHSDPQRTWCWLWPKSGHHSLIRLRWFCNVGHERVITCICSMLALQQILPHLRLSVINIGGDINNPDVSPWSVVFQLPIEDVCEMFTLKLPPDLWADMISCINTITKGTRGRLYLAHSMNLWGPVTSQSLRDSIIVWRRVPRDYIEITLCWQWRTHIWTVREQQLPTSGDISLFFIAFLWYLYL